MANILKRFTALTLTGAVFVGMTVAIYSASTSSAACCGDGAIAAQGATMAGSTVASAIGEAQGAIIQQLKMMEQTISNGFARVADEVNKSAIKEKLIAEGQAQVDTQLYMEEKRAEALEKFELSPRMCFDTAIGTATGIAAGETREGIDALNREVADRVLATPNTAAAISRIYTTHTKKYCSQADEKAGRCSAVEPGLQNADVRADALLAKTVLTPAEAEAARAFVANVVAPMPTQSIPKGWEKTPQGRAFVAGQLMEQAATSVAANSLNSAVAERLPVEGLGKAAMLNREDVSERDIMDATVRGRHGSVAWRKALAGMSTENLLRELNQQVAFGLYMDYKEYALLERMEAVLATDLALSVRQDSERRLQRAREAAAKAQ